MAKVFWEEAEMRKNIPSIPSVLAIGDSWFWYPFFGGSLITEIGPLVRPPVILARGMNGAEAYDYVDGKYAKQVRSALRLYGDALDAVFISGGGNDFAGFNDLRPLLKDSCKSETSAEGCFMTPALQGFLDQVEASYRKLIGVVYTYTKPGCKIIMHTYAYAIPTGKGVGGGKGWLRPALEDAGVPPALHEACVRHLLDGFHDVLAKIRSLDTENLDIVDSRTALTAHDWANEIHPNPAGFREIAERCWRPVLRKHGLAY